MKNNNIYLLFFWGALLSFVACDQSSTDSAGDNSTYQPLADDHNIAFHAKQFFDDPLPATRYERQGDNILFRLPGFENMPYVIQRDIVKGTQTGVKPFYSGYEVFRERGRYGVRKVNGTVTVTAGNYYFWDAITVNGNLLASTLQRDAHGVINVENKLIVPIVYRSVEWINRDLILGRTDTSATAYSPTGDTVYHLASLGKYYVQGGYIIEENRNFYDATTGKPVSNLSGQYAVRLQPEAEGFAPLKPIFGRGPNDVVKEVKLEGIFLRDLSEYEGPAGSQGTSKPGVNNDYIYLYTYQDTTYLTTIKYVFPEKFIDRDGTGERFIALRNSLSGNRMFFPAVKTSVEEFIEVRGDEMLEVRNILDVMPGKNAKVTQRRIYGHRVGG